MKRVLVTGADGLIGSSAVDCLAQAGHDVIALDRLPFTTAIGARSVVADLLGDDNEAVLRSLAVETVIHCAAVTPREFHGEDASRVAGPNSVMDRRIVSFCREAGLRLFYLSGTSVYGSEGYPWHENSPLAPPGPYLGQKVAGERLCSDSVRRSVIFRISSPYGPRQRKPTVLSTFIQRARRGDDLLYHGSGSRTQDFVSAKDVARAMLAALEDEAIGGVFNIASGQPICMKDLARLVVDAVGASGSQVRPSGEIDAQEQYRAVVSIEKAKRILGWSPSLSLAEGIREWLNALENIP